MVDGVGESRFARAAVRLAGVRDLTFACLYAAVCLCVSQPPPPPPPPPQNQQEDEESGDVRKRAPATVTDIFCGESLFWCSSYVACLSMYNYSSCGLAANIVWSVNNVTNGVSICVRVVESTLCVVFSKVKVLNMPRTDGRVASHFRLPSASS